MLTLPKPIDDALQGFSRACRSRNLPPAQVAAFVLLVVVAVSYAAFSFPAANAPGEFRVMVLGADGNSAGASRVTVSTLNGDVLGSRLTVDGEALFSTEGFPSNVVVRVTAPDGTERFLQARVTGAPVIISFSSSANASAPYEGILTITTVDKESGAIIPGVQFTLIAGGKSGQQSTDSNGVLRLPLEKGITLRIRAVKNGYYADSRTIIVESPTFTIRLIPRSTAGGSTLLQDYPDLEGNPVSISLSDEEFVVEQDDVLSTAGQRFYSSSTGTFETGSAEPGSITLTVRDNNGDLVQDGELRFIDSDTGEYYAVVPVNNGVAVVDEFDVNAPFDVYVNDGPEYSGTGSADNPFEGTVEVNYDGEPVGTIPVNNSQANGPSTDFVVTVVSSSGSPLQATVRVLDDVGAIVWEGLTDDTGEVKVVGLVAGAPITLLISSPGHASSTRTLNVGSSSRVTFQITQQGIETIVNTYDESQALLPSIVRIYSGTRLVDYASTQGTATFSLPEGDYVAVASAAGRRTLSTDAFPAGSTLDIPLVTLSTGNDVTYCKTVDATRTCNTVTADDLVTLTVQADDDASRPVQGATITATTAGVITATATTGASGSVQLQVTPGTVTIAASFRGATASRTIQVLDNAGLSLELPVGLAPTIFTATDSLSGAALQATFSSGNTECTGTTCTLQLPSDVPAAVTASAEGHASVQITANPRFGSARVYAVRLAPSLLVDPAIRQVTIAFQGATDAFGRPASRLSAGQDYVLSFELYGHTEGELSAAVRVEGLAGITEFEPGDSIWVEKSASYNPSPICTDLRNPNPGSDGLYRWVNVGFDGTQTRRQISIPIRVKNAASAPLTVHYRAQLSDGQGVLRAPPDAVLGSSPNAATLAGCYAESSSFNLPVTPRPSGDCTYDGQTIENGACLEEKPLKCADGEVINDALSCSCPSNQEQSGALCVQLSCLDGTPVGQCSQTQKPLSCTAQDGTVALDFAAGNNCVCPTGQALQGSDCVPCTGGSCTAATCPLDGASYGVGCISNRAPLYCGSDGALTENRVACGCPAGQQYDADLGECRAAGGLSCGSIPAGAGEASCDPSRKPKQCTSFGPNAFFADNPPVCNCPSGKELANGECIALTASPTPAATPTATASPAATPAPQRQCTNLGQCVSPGASEEFCTPQGVIVSSCGLCSPSCSGDYTCSVSGQCVPLTCRIDGVQNVEVGDCADGKPYRCENVNGQGFARADASCGCPDGYAPSDDGKTCQASATGEIASTSCPGTSGTVPGGSCYSASEFASDGARYRCVNKRKVADYSGCGCGEGFQHSIDGQGCVPEAGPQERPDSPSFQESCPGCTENDELYYNPATNRLETVTGGAEYAFAADSVFPADAMPFALRPTGSVLSIGLGKVESSTGTANCYKYDAAKGIILFSVKSSAFPTCPIINYGNSFYLNGRKISSDSAKFVFKTSSLPPSTKDLTVTVSFRDVADGLRVLPEQLSGPGTPQLAFLINQRPASFGPRVVKRSNLQMPYNDAVTALAWRGTGSLPLFEDVEPLATLSYDETPSYFECTGQLGLRAESCTDAFCCTGAWCDPTNVENAVNHFRSYAADLSASTAFRRGNGEPYKSLSAYYSAPIQVHMPIQLVEKALPSLRSSGFTVAGAPQACNADNPGVYDAVASTSDGETWAYSAKLLSIKRYGYLDDSCGAEQERDPSLANAAVAEQPLCNFLYGDCSCIASTPDNSLASNSQAKDPGPLQIESYFMGLPPKFAGPVGTLASMGLDSIPTGGFPLSLLLQGTQYYQPVACTGKGLLPGVNLGGANKAYRDTKPETNKACGSTGTPNWVQVNTPISTTGSVGLEGTPCAGSTPCTAKSAFVFVEPNKNSILEELRNCENEAGAPGISKCRARVIASLNLLSEQVMLRIESAAETCAANCWNAVPRPVSICPPEICTAIAPCEKKCGEESGKAVKQLQNNIEACTKAVNAEVSKGVACEALAGKLTDLPGVLPIPRSAWTTCYAYSDECSARCQPKKGYLLMIPLGKRILIMPHYGLDKDCRPTPPSLFGSFAKLPVNDMFMQYALYAGQSAFGGEFKGVNHVMQGLSIFSTVQAGLSEFKNCDIPLKPAQTDRDKMDVCPKTVGEADTKSPGSTSGRAPETPAGTGDQAAVDGAAANAAAPSSGSVGGSHAG